MIPWTIRLRPLCIRALGLGRLTPHPCVRGIRIHLPMRLIAEAPSPADTVSASEPPARRARWTGRSSTPSVGFKESIMEQKLKIAVFIDFDNIEIGVKSTLHREFDVAAVLDALKERGEIVTKFAYAN